MSYAMQKYIPIEQGTPGWQFSPVPTWGGNPLNAGPRRVGVGCGPAGCGADDPYKEVGWGMVAAGAAVALIAGLLIGNAAGKKKYAANARRRRSSPRMKSGRTRMRQLIAMIEKSEKDGIQPGEEQEIQRLFKRLAERSRQ